MMFDLLLHLFMTAFLTVCISVPVIAIVQVTGREAENRKSRDTGKDLILAATRRRDDGAANVATDVTVCCDKYEGSSIIKMFNSPKV